MRTDLTRKDYKIDFEVSFIGAMKIFKRSANKKRKLHIEKLINGKRNILKAHERNKGIIR